MNKKGSHADWAISMGIFLVYLLVLFIVIRPGIEPVHDEDILLDIVEDGFSNDVKWVVKMSPLFVRTCKAMAHPVKIIVRSDDWDFREAIPNKKSAYGTDYCLKKQGDFELTCGGWEKRCAPATDRTFNLYYVPKNRESRDENPNLELICTGVEGKDCTAELGSSENFEGINWEWLGELKGRGYDEIKEGWDFPRTKDFSILIDDKDIFGEGPYEQTDVFVREWKDFEVYGDGKRNEVKVSIKVW